MNGPATRATRATLGTPATTRASLWLVGSLIAGAWLIAIVAEITGTAQALHHHALISSGGPPFWIAVPLSLVSWQVMIAAMMLPASLPAVEAFGSWVTVSSAPGGPRRMAANPWPTAVAVVAFLGVYAVAWSVFGLAAFLGDAGLHSLVHSTAWLAARPQLIGAAVLAIAGAYQLLPFKHRGLAACRQPDHRGSIDDPVDHSSAHTAFHAGLRHAIDCIASSWALMLLMFAAGFANLLWMAVLTAVMTYEAMGRYGHGVAAGFGVVLLALAAGSILGLVPVF